MLSEPRSNTCVGWGAEGSAGRAPVVVTGAAIVPLHDSLTIHGISLWGRERGRPLGNLSGMYSHIFLLLYTCLLYLRVNSLCFYVVFICTLVIYIHISEGVSSCWLGWCECFFWIRCKSKFWKLLPVRNSLWRCVHHCVGLQRGCCVLHCRGGSFSCGLLRNQQSVW